MAHEGIYLKTTTRDQFVEAVEKTGDKIVKKTILNHYYLNKKKFGPQEKIIITYPLKYQVEYLYTNGDLDYFVSECKKRYPKTTISTIKRSFYRFRERDWTIPPQSLKHTKTKKITEQKKSVPKLYKLEKKQPELIVEEEDDNLIPINEVVEPSPLKLLELKDMQRLGYYITETFLRKHGFTKYEINWLRYKEIIK